MTSLKGFSTSIEAEIKTGDYFQFVIDTVKKTVKQDDNLITQILCTGLSARTSEPLNLAVIAPTSEGKTYPVIQTIGYFPKDQVWSIGKMSPKTLIRMKGELIDGRTNQPISGDVKRLRREISLLSSSKTDKQKKIPLSDELDELLENSKTVIDLSGKILVFLEPPDQELWEIIKPILSHDKDEIDYPYVNKDDMVTKSILIRGQPACIFCSAKDESDWPQWPEVASRFLITSPNMVQQKYLESNILIAQKAGLPKTLQQDIIISDRDIELAKECVIHIEDQMAKFSGVWIPYHKILANALPDEKGTDSRATKRIFSLLHILPLVRSNLRPRLDYCDENLVIATLEDLGDVLRLTRNTSSIPVYKMRFFNEIFSPCCNDISGASKMVTTRQLCDYLKDKTGSFRHVHI